ncbi:MAG TPA: OmpA family protein, partial [Ferruginibacter sp.]|nr:OmpA family protein [Ferruginibacter sp.]
EGGALLNKGAGLLKGLFGNKLDGLTGLLSNFAGVKSASISSLMSIAAPAIMGLIGKHASENNLSAGNITSLLNDQKANINTALPTGLNLSNVLGNFGGIEQTISNVAHHTDEPVAKKGNVMRIILPLILFALLAMGSYYFKGCNKNPEMITYHPESSKTNAEHASVKVKTSTVAVTGKVDSLTGDFIYNTGSMVNIDLPNNAGKLAVGEFSTENKLYKFLSDAGAAVDTVKGNWFEFTNVRFKTGSSDITDESMIQLKNMVAITKGFPSAQFKIGGYTDNTGSMATNISLSQKRADAVEAILKKLGASSNSFTGAKGYGPEWPIADNATAEGRAQNRRVAVNVKAK